MKRPRDDQPSDELKNPFPPSPAKKPEKPVDPCASTCQDVRAKKKTCDKASSACDTAYKEAKRNCKKACDEAARTAPCGGDPDCLRIVDDQNKTCCGECDRTSYDLAACTEKDRVGAGGGTSRRHGPVRHVLWSRRGGDSGSA